MPEHKIHCPSCAQHLSVPEELAGQQIDCPSCNKPMTLPDFAHAFDEEEERIEEPRQSPALIAGIVAGVLVFGGLGVFLLMGPDKPADEPEVATLPATQTTLPNPGDERAVVDDFDFEGFSKEVQKAFEMTMPGMMPFGMGMNPNDPFGMGMMPGMMPYGMGMDPFGMGMDPMLEDEIKIINERLAKGISLNQYNQWGQTELMVAMEADDIDLARRLLENKAYPNAASKDGQLNTALHLAAINENKELCELLIDKGARVNKKNKIGFTPLDSTIYFNEMPGFGGELPEPTEANKATVAYLKSKGAKSMTPEQRAAADPGLGGMMMPAGGPFGFPGGMPPGMGMDPNDPFGGYGFPAYGSPGAPKGKKPAKSKRQ